MKDRTYYQMSLLFDFYGELLTGRQRDFFDLYYNENLSLSEIAENAGISRQGVRDVIVRAAAVMQDIEDKTGFIRRFEQQRRHLDAILSATVALKECLTGIYGRNCETQTHQWQSKKEDSDYLEELGQLERLTEIITAETAALKDLSYGF